MMEQHTKDKFEELFKEMIKHEFKHSDMIILMVSTEDTWEQPLPNELLEQKFMMLVLANWSLEHSDVSDDGVLVVTAFGETENSKLFPWYEIQAIMMEDGTPIMYRPYDATPEIPVMPSKLSDIMHTPEGEKKSMEMFRKNNPQLFKE